MKARHARASRKASVKAAGAHHIGITEHAANAAQGGKHHHGMFQLGIFKPSVGKITFALLLMVALFLLLLLDLPDNVNTVLLYLITWPLFLVTGPCGIDKACLQPASFAGVVLMLLYWYVTASLVEGIWNLRKGAA